MRIITLDGGMMISKEGAHEYIAKTLSFPRYYGKNLDALADCLSELPRGTVIYIIDSDKARSTLGEYADRIFEVFGELSQEGALKFVKRESAVNTKDFLAGDRTKSEGNKL